MLKISKMQNVYGIKNLLNPELLSGNTIIYAPNGVMKTSLSDGLSMISRGLVPKDVFANVSSSFEIVYAGKTFSNESKEYKLPLIIYSDKVVNSNVFERPEISRLVMSKEMRSKYLELLGKTENYQKNVIDCVADKIIGNISKTDLATKLVMETYQGVNIIENICKIEKDSLPLDKEVLEIPYSDIFNDKTEIVISNPKFQEQVFNYVALLKQKFDEPIFKENFNLNELIAMNAAAVTNNYFKAGHLLKIGEDLYDEIGTKALIDKLINRYFLHEDIKNAFDEITKLIKNKETRKFSAILEHNKQLLPKLLEPQRLKYNYISTVLYSSFPEFDKIKLEIADTALAIKELKSKSSESVQTWHEVINEYNAIFLNKIFDIRINNVEEATVGEKLPEFRKLVKGSNTVISSEINERFSSGEKKAILVLNIMFDVKLHLLDNDFVTLVLDDIIESFDYKNKYAMIEYLKILSSNPKLQLIILTHNFDFYRSCRIALKENLQSKLFAYSKDGNVTLYKNSESYYDNFSYFNVWKKHKNILYVIALLPFLRNLEQLKNGNDCESFKQLCKFLHYGKETDTIDLGVLYNLFCMYDFVLPESYCESKYIDQLQNACTTIFNKRGLLETDLSAKIILGIGLRVFSDRYMWNKHVEFFGKIPEIDSEINCSRELFNSIQSQLTKDELTMLNSAMTIAPSFIHVNSFMYEPLIDIGTEKLIETTKSVLGI